MKITLLNESPTTLPIQVTESLSFFFRSVVLMSIEGLLAETVKGSIGTADGVLLIMDEITTGFRTT
jgi:hypothetical protein